MKKMTPRKIQWALPVALIAFVSIFFLVLYGVYPNTSNTNARVIPWMVQSWMDASGDYMHGWAVPVLFVFFVKTAWSTMAAEPVKPSILGLVVLVFGVLLFLVSVRTLQPRIALFGLPFYIFGSVLFVWGWCVARHMLFPAFFWYFAITLPGIQQATNGLQVVVTQSCYHFGTFIGLELVNSGNNITSATGKWETLNIAEGCSGIRSLMALVMIAAIYAYFTQKKVWKMAALFACALPLALVANFFRIFTIIVLAEMGFARFAAGAYHDWAGLLFFFPIALAGLFLIDKLLNWKENQRVVVKRVQ